MVYEDLDYTTLLNLLVTLTEKYSKAIHNPVLGNEFPGIKTDLEKVLAEINRRKNKEKKPA